jgi:uncharacterized protein YuzE
MSLLKITIDESGNAIYMYLSENPVAKTVAASDSINVDVDTDGEVVGVELMKFAGPVEVSSLKGFIDEQSLPYEILAKLSA